MSTRSMLVSMLAAGIVEVATGAEPAAPAGAPPREVMLEDATPEELEEAFGIRTLNRESAVLNGFHVESSLIAHVGPEKDEEGRKKATGVQLEDISVAAEGVFRTSITRGGPHFEGGHVNLFHRDAGAMLLSSGDGDGDGRLNYLEYTVVDTAGRPVVTVYDYQADGQADMRLHFREDRFTEIWHADRWHRVEKRGEVSGINLDGRFVELQRDANNNWVVPAAPR